MYRRILMALTATALALWAFAGTLASAEESDDEFGYECETCPANWGNLDDDFEACIEGSIQSPIAFDKASAQPEDLDRLRPKFDESDLEVERLTINFEAFVESGNFTRVGDKRFELIQFHFHSTSEHVIDGERYPLEMHFVHQASDGSLAVIGVFIKEGDRLDALDPLIVAIQDVLLLDEGEFVEVEETDIDEILPRSLSSYRYIGSTTTPPCTEGVSWILLDQVIEMSSWQIETIQDVIRELNEGFDNNRPIQNRNGRIVMTDVPSDEEEDD